MRLLPAIVCRIKGMPNSGILALLPLVCHTAIAILGILVRDSSWRNTTISEISSILPPRIYYTWFHSMCYTWFDFVSSMLRICFYLLRLFVYIMWILVWKTTDSNQKYSFVSLAPLPSRQPSRDEISREKDNRGYEFRGPSNFSGRGKCYLWVFHEITIFMVNEN